MELTMRRRYLPLARLQQALAFALAAVFLVYPSRIEAQITSCNQAQAILLNPSSLRDDLYMAMAKAVRCPGDGPRIIATVLRQATPLSTLDTIARQGAYALLDRRLTDSVRVLATDPTQTTERRTLFLRLLTRYAAANAAVDASQINSQPTPSVLLAVQDAGGVLGTYPPDATSRNNARATIHHMSLNDSDATLRKLAGLVYVQLQDYMQP